MREEVRLGDTVQVRPNGELYKIVSVRETLTDDNYTWSVMEYQVAPLIQLKEFPHTGKWFSSSALHLVQSSPNFQLGDTDDGGKIVIETRLTLDQGWTYILYDEGSNTVEVITESDLINKIQDALIARSQGKMVS